MSENFLKAFGKDSKAFSNALYALCDFETLQKKELSLMDFIGIVQNKNAKLIQYRDKVSSFEQQKKNLILLKKHLDIPIIINDTIELIDFAHGLHLGQEDLFALHTNKELAIKLVRKKIGDKLLGLSTHNEIEILQANELDLDMIGLGAYRQTSTKNVSDILGEKLSYLAKMSQHPVCAIGGVTNSDILEHVTFNVIGSALYYD